MDKNLSKKVAALLGENPSLVSMVIEESARFVEKTIRSGELKNVRIPMLGLFHVNLKQLRYLTEHKPSLDTKVITVEPLNKTDEKTLRYKQRK